MLTTKLREYLLYLKFRITTAVLSRFFISIRTLLYGVGFQTAVLNNYYTLLAFNY